MGDSNNTLPPISIVKQRLMQGGNSIYTVKEMFDIFSVTYSMATAFRGKTILTLDDTIDMRKTDWHFIPHHAGG